MTINRRKLIAVIVFMAAMLAGLGILFAILKSKDLFTGHSGLRIGFIEQTTSTEWKCTYHEFSGELTHTIKVTSGTLEVDITTNEGSISLEIVDEKGNNVYRGNDLSTCSFSVGTKGKTTIKVTGDKHSGAFEFKASEKTAALDKGEGAVNGFVSISSAETKEIFKTEGDYIILDVRRADEFATGHIPGAINVANESISDTEPAELPNKDQAIYVYCRSGNRSKQAAGKLAAMGYTNIIEFGGILNWSGSVVTE